MTASKTPPWKWRKRATAALEAYFESRSYPRSMVTLLLFLAGAAGFLVSDGLLRGGVEHMWMRYPIAVLAIEQLTNRRSRESKSVRRRRPDIEPR